MALELPVCPSSLTEGYTTYSPSALNSLFGGREVTHILAIPSPSQTQDERNVKHVGRLSLSGAQSKFGVVLTEENELRYSLMEEQSGYILKPKPVGYHILRPEYCAANENLTMQMASQIYDIETAANGLCFYSDGEAAYLTRRFDVHPGGKYAQEDFAALLGLTRENGGSDYKYCNGSYEECGEVIREIVKSSMVDLFKFFRIVLYNFITLNDDAHLKNFSLISDGKEYHLTPAYDLINTSLHLYEPRIFALEKGLFREGMMFSDTRGISFREFEEFGRRLGLPKKLVRQEIERFSAPNPEADALIDRSFLSDTLKDRYKTSYHFRQFMIRPQ